MVKSCACFGPRHSPYSNYLCCAFDIVAVGTIFNIFSYNAVLDRERQEILNLLFLHIVDDPGTPYQPPKKYLIRGWGVVDSSGIVPFRAMHLKGQFVVF